jgi:tRNA G18 (ribose-2'-O)-methylase SpoU
VFLLGAGGPGPPPSALAAADLRVRIPMAPGVDSLNVATAAAVAFHALTPLEEGDPGDRLGRSHAARGRQAT